MIGFVTVGTNDLPRAAAFYDQLFEAIHGHRVFSSELGVIWSLSQISPGFGVFTPGDGQPATACNGSVVGLEMVSRAAVDKLYAQALTLGAQFSDAGPHQTHHPERFYIHYFRDLDGNKLGVYFMDEFRHHGRS